MGPVPDNAFLWHGDAGWMDAGAFRRIGLRVALQLRHHPDAAVIVVGSLGEARPVLHALAQFRPSVASTSFFADLPLAMREGVTLYDANELRERGARITERTTAILIEGESVSILERA